MRQMRVFGLVALLAATGGAEAQLSGPGLTLPALTGQQVAFDLSPTIGLRGWVGGHQGMLASDGLQASSMVLADWRPLASGFRFSGGLAYGPLWSATSMPGLALDRSLGDPWDVNAGVDSRSWLARGNPYLGLGWGLGSGRKGPYLSADLGLMYQRGGLSTWGCPAGIPSTACAPDLRASEQGAAAEDVRIAPVMSLGVGLRF
ncbi:MAG TPA: hypothetical protein PLW72_09595 [Burkholderiaceae bacterium]|nr:hypothetical protein [Burkholderiaceae bacterium]